MTEKHQCTRQLWNKGSWSSRTHPCPRSGVLFEDGQWWCKTDAPSAVKARDDAWRAVQARKSEQWREDSRREAAMKRACAPFTTDALLQGVVAEMLAVAKALVAISGRYPPDPSKLGEVVGTAEAVLAKAEQKEGQDE